MTTLVATQRALEHLSMSNQQERRRSKRQVGKFLSLKRERMGNIE